MRKKMLLIAVVLGSAVAQESRAGEYVLGVDQGLPDKTAPAFSKSATTGDPSPVQEDTSGATQSTDRQWTWAGTDEFDSAPMYWLKGTVGWDAATLTANSTGTGNSAKITSGYKGTLQSLAPGTMLPLDSANLGSGTGNNRILSKDDDGLRTATIPAPAWGPVLVAFQAPPQVMNVGDNDFYVVIGRLEAGIRSRRTELHLNGSGTVAASTSQMRAYGGYFELTPNY